MTSRAVSPDSGHCQRAFHQRWGHLSNPHVRALAWLLDAPDLLDRQASRWDGCIASLEEIGLQHETATFLAELDRDPEPLLATLHLTSFTRLGRYAESLLALYLQNRGVLVAHGVQVRDGKNTIGEFDFLLHSREDLVHWEFATKFYLLESSGAGHDADYFVGPNLADTLGAKMDKIFGRQLKLSAHPAAATYLPAPIAKAQALVKGWLFYKNDEALKWPIPGLADVHCRGFWCACEAVKNLGAARYAVLSRLQWLAPARLKLADTMTQDELLVRLGRHFMDDTMPVLVALMQANGAEALEVDRGFIVPDDWRTRAGQRIGLGR